MQYFAFINNHFTELFSIFVDIKCHFKLSSCIRKLENLKKYANNYYFINLGQKFGSILQHSGNFTAVL